MSTYRETNLIKQLQTWYLFFVDGFKGASTKPPNTAPLRSPTTWKCLIKFQLKGKVDILHSYWRQDITSRLNPGQRLLLLYKVERDMPCLHVLTYKKDNDISRFKNNVKLKIWWRWNFTCIVRPISFLDWEQGVQHKDQNVYFLS